MIRATKDALDEAYDAWTRDVKQKKMPVKWTIKGDTGSGMAGNTNISIKCVSVNRDRAVTCEVTASVPTTRVVTISAHHLD